jgi:hypothetical protein
MSALPPLEFLLCAAGAVLGATLVPVLGTALLRRAGRVASLRRVARCERASAAIELPFVLFVLIEITLLTWQLGFLASAYLVVDGAAFLAARSAVVRIPETVVDAGASSTRVEDPNALLATESPLTEAPGARGKAAMIREAAAFGCFGIVGRPLVVSGAVPADAPATPRLSSLLGEPFLQSHALEFDRIEQETPGDFASRFEFAWERTRVRIDGAVDARGGLPVVAPGAPVTVHVEHEFPLRIPFAGGILSGFTSRPDLGFFVVLRGRGCLPNEGFPEVRPAGAPAEARAVTVPAPGVAP